MSVMKVSHRNHSSVLISTRRCGQRSIHPSILSIPGAQSNLGHDKGVELEGVKLGLSELFSPRIARHAQKVYVADTWHLHACVVGNASIGTEHV